MYTYFLSMAMELVMITYFSSMVMELVMYTYFWSMVIELVMIYIPFVYREEVSYEYIHLL